MSAGTIFFVFCALVALIGAICTVVAQNPIRCAVGLLATILGIAGLFLKLDAQFLAAIQLIVYAGAVVVLFVFVIMLLGPDAGQSSPTALLPPRATVSRTIGGVLLGLLSAAALLLTAKGTTMVRFDRAAPEHGSIEAVGGQLFSKAIVPFELATALLVVAVVGAIAVARGNPRKKAQKQVQSASARLFGGPIHPRDAGHPLPKESAQ